MWVALKRRVHVQAGFLAGSQNFQAPCGALTRSETHSTLWMTEAFPARRHQYQAENKGRAAPYRIFDVGRNKGFVNVGISKDTVEFAVTTLKLWRDQMSFQRYKGARRLYITADGAATTAADSGFGRVNCKSWPIAQA